MSFFIVQYGVVIQDFAKKNDVAFQLRRGDGRVFWPKQNIYDDRVGATRFLIGNFGVD